MLGSMPRISTTSRSASGGLATDEPGRRPLDAAGLAVGQGDRRPVDLEVVELLRVEVAIGRACHTCSRCSTAAVEASAASFQPSKAAMATGERSTGRPSNSVT